MSEGMNKAILLGNCTADPELRFTQGGQAVLNIRMATNESYVDKDKQRKERTDYHQVVVWGPRAEALGKILAKGSGLQERAVVEQSVDLGRRVQARGAGRAGCGMKPIFSIRSVGQRSALETLACCFFWRAQVRQVLRAGTRGMA